MNRKLKIILLSFWEVSYLFFLGPAIILANLLTILIGGGGTFLWIITFIATGYWIWIIMAMKERDWKASRTYYVKHSRI